MSLHRLLFSYSMHTLTVNMEIITVESCLEGVDVLSGEMIY